MTRTFRNHLAIIVILLGNMAFAQQKVRLHFNDGTSSEFPMEKLDSITFATADDDKIDTVRSELSTDSYYNDINSLRALANSVAACVITQWDEGGVNRFGYAAQMIQRDMMTGDYLHTGSIGYDWFSKWARNLVGESDTDAEFNWAYLYRNIARANSLLQISKNFKESTDEVLSYYGMGYAYRALWHLDLARMYEFLPTDNAYINNLGAGVRNLTAPIVTSYTIDDTGVGGEFSTNGQRATREQMAAFIESDLNEAEKYIGNLVVNEQYKTALPDISCVYGLKARLYMWTENYEQARKYARMAIDSSRTGVLTYDQALDIHTGYNTGNQFMWAAIQTVYSQTVQSGYANWTSWVSNQISFGFTGYGTDLFLCIDKAMYNRINDDDWRKLQWMSPDAKERTKSPVLSPADTNRLPDYASIKFRPANGVSDNSEGAATDFPLMRVEEMYFIEAEAAEHMNAGEGAVLLERFMRSYRCSTYSCTAKDVIDEIVFQKRVELWGEGQTYFDIKRLNMSVTRVYDNTNWTDYETRMNTQLRPAWMNLMIPLREIMDNDALQGKNNPDHTGCYPKLN